MIIVHNVFVNETWSLGECEYVSFDINLSTIGLPMSMVNEAQAVDLENYTPSCFITKVLYEHDSSCDKSDMYLDMEYDCDIAYITCDGEPICFDYKLKDYELQNVFQKCYDELIKIKGANE